MSYTLDRKAAAIYAAERLVELGDFQSITITRQGTSEDFSVVLVTLSSDISEMTLTHSPGEGITYATPLRMI